jgi:hypothetical protein
MANDIAGLLFNTEKRPNRVGGSEGAASGSFDPNQRKVPVQEVRRHAAGK